MFKLPLSFGLLTITGYWRPTEWPADSYRYWLYNVYSALMILSLYFFGICFFVDAMLAKDLKTATLRFSVFISVGGVCIKVANVFVHRRKIIKMMNTLVQGNCLPRDEEERIIQRKFDDYAKNLTIWVELLNFSTCVFATLAKFDELIKTRTFPMYNWTPFSVESIETYMTCLVHQSVNLMVCASTDVAVETLMSGLMIQVSAQLEIFSHRARNLPTTLREEGRTCTSMQDLKKSRMKILGNLIQYHLQIFEFAEVVNAIFQYIIFLQFCISSIVLCLTIYTMSTESSLDINFLWSFFYLGSMLMQVYLFCWFGNEATLKSQNVCNAIYEMDWTTLPVSVLKDLLTIMLRASRPVLISSGHVVTLSTETLMAIVKMSYSSYNLLKETSNK